MSDRVAELEKRLREAREAYYNLAPVISDQEYDALKDELSSVSAGSPEVVAVGAPAPQFSVWEKVRHEIPMGSLGKANSTAEFREWAEKTGAKTFFITHKIDGSSMELVYEGGKLVRCVTRGDGVVGEDVTANVSQVPDIPHTIEMDGRVTVRGEIVMLKKVFEEQYAGEYANPRNTAAAKVREKKGGGADCRNLSFVAYWMSEHPDRPETFFHMIGLLKHLGFTRPTFSAMGTLEAVEQNFANARERRAEIPYEIDGMVVSVALISKMEALGDLNMRPRGQIAWKFDAEMRETRVADVKWQVGPTGRVTPVAVLEPVSIGGVTITNVSLHNLTLFQELALFPQCRVLVSRRNDVIPYIEKNLGT